MKIDEKIWDVVVIGGGAAGMMAAGRASECGASVLILEKNNSLGKKLLITGGGRCNVTNAEPDMRKFLSYYNTKERKNDQFLFSSFSSFGPEKTREFFHNHSMPTKVEELNRVFPESNSAQSVWNTLVQYMNAGKVIIFSQSPVLGFIKSIDGIIEGVKIKKNNLEKIIYARNFILATGGTSHPETGSSGDGFLWLKEIGHIVTDESVALVPIRTEENWVTRLSGLSLPEVKITLLLDNVKQESKIGKLLFTHTGLSGPAILNMSRNIRDLLPYGKVEIALDLLPAYDHSETNIHLQEMLKNDSNKKFKNILNSILPSTLVPVIVSLSQINPDTKAHSITREERIKLISLLKNVRIHVTGLLGLEKAVVTSGGVSPQEIDFKTMKSRLFTNLFVAGDIIDIDRPTGGFSLQLCWTTGYLAGEEAAKKQKNI